MSPALSTARYRYVHSPTSTGLFLVRSESLTECRQELDSPPVHRRMIDRHRPLGHHFFQMTQTQRMGDVPTYTGRLTATEPATVSSDIAHHIFVREIAQDPGVNLLEVGRCGEGIFRPGLGTLLNALD